MKLRATKKEMKEGYNKIISIGYCDAQYLLRDRQAFAYSSGAYGWACDYYDVNGVLISTGYNYINDKNAKSDYKLVREYDTKAIDCTPEERERLLQEFVAICVK